MARLTGIGCSRCRSSRSSSSTRRLSGKISCIIWRLEGKIDGFVLTGKISRFSSPSCPSCNGCRCSQGCEISRISWWCSSPGTLIRKDLHKFIEIIRAICQQATSAAHAVHSASASVAAQAAHVIILDFTWNCIPLWFIFRLNEGGERCSSCSISIQQLWRRWQILRLWKVLTKKFDYV